MKAITIYPEDIGASGYWSERWIKLISKLGWQQETPVWQCATIINIEID